MASGNPEIIYGVQLLDDLHNYFPDLLYNNQRFTTVQSVLQYITSSTRRRFDLFSYGRTQYNNRANVNIVNAEDETKENDDDEDAEEDEDVPAAAAAVPAPAAAAPVTPAPAVPASARGGSPPAVPRQRLNRTYASALNGSQTQSLYSLLPTFDSLIYTTIPTLPAVDGVEQIESNLNLLSAIAGFFPNNNQLPRSFLDPVPVFPTPAQVSSATTIRTLEADMEDNCSICQDTMRAGEAIRHITACNHTFHRSCVDTWFVRNVRCPVCRHDIRETRADPTAAQTAPPEQQQMPGGENQNMNDVE